MPLHYANLIVLAITVNFGCKLCALLVLFVHRTPMKYNGQEPVIYIISKLYKLTFYHVKTKHYSYIRT